MLTCRVIPCLDVRDGIIVKGVRFANLRHAGDPVERAAMYERQGADEIVILDVSATAEGRAATVDTIASVRSVLSIPLTVGGGIRTTADAAQLLESGADKISVNTAAVHRPELITELANHFGIQCTVVAIDASRSASEPGWEVVTCAGSRRTKIDVAQWARHAVDLGAGEVLLTSFDSDGTKAGYDVDLIARIRESVPLPLIASGGAAIAQHMAAAIGAGADAVLAASMFHDSETTVCAVKNTLAGYGIEVRR